MRKVTIISTSPRRGGNSDPLCDELAAILTSLEMDVRQIIWGEGVWKPGEAVVIKTVEVAYAAGRGFVKR